MQYTPEQILELNTLLRFDLTTTQTGIKVHTTADPAIIAATERLFNKGLVTLVDGGYLTPRGREVAEHAHAALTLLVASKRAATAL